MVLPLNTQNTLPCWVLLLMSLHISALLGNVSLTKILHRYVLFPLWNVQLHLSQEVLCSWYFDITMKCPTHILALVAWNTEPKECIVPWWVVNSNLASFCQAICIDLLVPQIAESHSFPTRLILAQVLHLQSWCTVYTANPPMQECSSIMRLHSEEQGHVK